MGELAQVPHYPETRTSPGGYLHRTWSFGIRSGQHSHAPGSSSASCCCNGSVGLNWNTTCIWYVEVWEPKIDFYPSAGGFEKKKKKKKNLRNVLLTFQVSYQAPGLYVFIDDTAHALFWLFKKNVFVCIWCIRALSSLSYFLVVRCTMCFSCHVYYILFFIFFWGIFPPELLEPVLWPNTAFLAMTQSQKVTFGNSCYWSMMS